MEFRGDQLRKDEDIEAGDAKRRFVALEHRWKVESQRRYAGRSKVNRIEYGGQGYPAWVDPDGSSLFSGSAAGWGGFTNDYREGTFNSTKTTYHKNLMLFIEQSGAKFWNMVPSHSLVGNSSENSWIAKSGTEYVAYILNDTSATLDSSAASGTLYCKLFDCKTAGWSSEQTVSGGAVRTFNLRGAVYNFNEAPFTGTDTSSWTDILTIRCQTGSAWYSLGITSFYNAHLGQTVTFHLKPACSPGAAVWFEDRENTWGTGNTPYISYVP